MRTFRALVFLVLAFASSAAPVRTALAQDASSPEAKPAGPLAIASTGPQFIPLGKVTLQISGSGFVKGAVVSLNQNALATKFHSAKKLSATTVLAPIPGNTYAITVANPSGAPTPPFPLFVNIKKPKVSYAAAFRMLDQATWGPQVADALALQKTGFSAWLTAQIDTAPSAIAPPPANSSPLYAQAEFVNNAVNGADQLRQRVAFSLGQVFVISALKIPVEGLVPYLNLLSQSAFANYKNAMSAITLSPAMGLYLDMVDNDKPNPNQGTLPNENYAREFLQLFTIGTAMLNLDGSAKLDNLGNPIPTYTQTDIQNLARVFTGWTYPIFPGNPPQQHNPPFFVGQMVAVDSNHDMDAKTFIGQAMPAGQTAQQDLDQALGIVFNHPNVGPFVALRLIQHLVTSNPTPAYVQRIATVFNDNGHGTRGDLGAVVRAILLDAEARQGDSGNPAATGGHLREPILYATAMLRALGAHVDNTNLLAEYINGYGLGQELLFPPSVFNYYSPFSRIPGGQYSGPEFQLLTPSTAVLRADFAIALLVSNMNNMALGPGVLVDFSPFIFLAANDNALLDGVGRALFGGQMPANLRATLKTAVDATGDAGTRAFDALFLAMASAQYQVEQ